jgi:hypothetical protein
MPDKNLNPMIPTSNLKLLEWLYQPMQKRETYTLLREHPVMVSIAFMSK